MARSFFIIFLYIIIVDCVIYDRSSGKVRDDLINVDNNLCQIDLKPCTPPGISRTDGTCNNFKSPIRGAAMGPYMRMLPPDYGANNGIRKNRNNGPLPSAREVRTHVMTTGRVDRSMFTVAAVHMMEFIHRDVSLMKGPRDYLQNRQYCCEDVGRSDPRCIPIAVPSNDPYLKLTDIRCLNFSRAESFQDIGCSPTTMAREQINFQTPLLDLSTIYGVDDNALSKVRSFRDGLLILEKRENRYVPMNITREKVGVNDNTNVKENDKVNETGFITDSSKPSETVTNNVTKATNENICIQNKENETLCYQFGFPEAGNYGLRTTTLGIFFMREHNRIATALRQMNPCWKDDRLFKVAKQINIATAANIFLYELLPLFMGYKNMISFDVASEQYRYVNKYNDEELPMVYAEYEIATRFFNTLLDGRVKLYTESHHYAGEFSHSETLFRQALIEQDKNFEQINRGTFYQSSARLDDIQDPELSDNFYANLQKAHDLAAIDIQRGRDMGIRGYNDYRQFCGLKSAKVFEDLLDVMDAEKMEALKQLYSDVSDIDLLAGIMSENFVQGSHVGPTLFCIMTKQLHVFKYSDRFWYERSDQLHSFTPAQLLEVRKTNMARLACDNAEGIKYIQPNAFSVPKIGNEQVPCNQILGMNLLKWEDTSCRPYKESQAPQIPTSFMENGIPENFTSFFDQLLSYKPSQWFPRSN